MDITESVLAQRDKALVGGDYNSYHAQTARRIHAIRKRLGVTTRRGQKFSSKGTVSAADIAKNTEYAQAKAIGGLTDKQQMGTATARERRAIMDKCHGYEVCSVSRKHSKANAWNYEATDSLETQQGRQICYESC